MQVAKSVWKIFAVDVVDNYKPVIGFWLRCSALLVLYHIFQIPQKPLGLLTGLDLEASVLGFKWLCIKAQHSIFYVSYIHIYLIYQPLSTIYTQSPIIGQQF